jgi:hypothetical protein
MSELVATLLKWLAAILALAAVFGVGYEVFGASNSANHASDLGTLASNMKQLYQGQPSFTSISTAIAYKQAPARMKSATVGTMVNPYNGNVTVTADANPSFFDLTTNGVPDADCPKIATTLGGYSSITINGTTLTAAGGVDAGAVSNACGTPGNNTNVITLVYGH